MTKILAIDPGLSGAGAVLDTKDGELLVWDMPVFVLKRNRKNKREIDHHGLVRLIREHGPYDVAVLEKVASAPNQGVSSVFAFGRATGIVVGVLACEGVVFEEVAPGEWKRRMKLTGRGKDGSRALATQLRPMDAELFARVKDDGRAEAFLMAQDYVQRVGGKYAPKEDWVAVRKPKARPAPRGISEEDFFGGRLETIEDRFGTLADLRRKKSEE